MMRHQAHGALEAALELSRMPLLAEPMRLQPLPQDVLPLIRVAAGCRRTCHELADASGHEPHVIERAAPFYLEQVLLQPEGDPYRTLGLPPGASRDEMREHLRWLMKWLHPDRNRTEWESVFAGRVLAAWQALQEADRNACQAEMAAAETGAAAGRPLRPRWVADRVADIPISPPQLLMLIVAWSIVLTLLLVPAFRDFWLPFGGPGAEAAGEISKLSRHGPAEAP